MNDRIRASILREVHRVIAEAADAGVARITRLSSADGSNPTTCLDYPPSDNESDEHMLTATESTALVQIASSDVAMNGLRKVLREAASAPLFHLFCLLDGVADPQDWDDGVWLGANLVPPRDDESREMLHDEFLDSYWDFVERGAR